MRLSSNIPMALVISVLHLLLSFILKLPEKYKKMFRTYSIVVNLLFIGFFISFSMFLNIDQYIATYYNGLATLYFCLAVPIGTVLFLLFRKWMMEADLEPILLKHILVAGMGIVEVVLLIVGYALFILTFYGFAP